MVFSGSPPHSAAKAVRGSTCDARRAGIHVARTATMPTNAAAPANVDPSVVLTPYSIDDSTRVNAKAPASPIATPMATTRAPSPSKARTTLSGVAPSARRTAISRRHCLHVVHDADDDPGRPIAGEFEQRRYFPPEGVRLTAKVLARELPIHDHGRTSRLVIRGIEHTAGDEMNARRPEVVAGHNLKLRAGIPAVLVHLADWTDAAVFESPAHREGDDAAGGDNTGR